MNTWLGSLSDSFPLCLSPLFILLFLSYRFLSPLSMLLTYPAVIFTPATYLLRFFYSFLLLLSSPSCVFLCYSSIILSFRCLYPSSVFISWSLLSVFLSYPVIIRSFCNSLLLLLLLWCSSSVSVLSSSLPIRLHHL